MNQTRRSFLASSATLTIAAMTLPACVNSSPQTRRQPVAKPWYRRVVRWGQTNITEADPANYDLDWWRGYWKRTRVQGLIINAGGIVAYYPSNFPLQFRPETLGKRDLFGELLHAAREEGLTVLARMDSNRAHESFYNAHPDWFAVDAVGRPHKAGELFVSCVNSPYYDEYLPGILREIIDRYHPEGFADNSWSGLGREIICYCQNCSTKFQEHNGRALPRQKNWDDAGYREWIVWNYARRLELWDQNNRVTRAAGGPDCLWIGMNSGSISGQCQSFRDYRGICARAEMILLDHQARSDNEGFAQNAEIGQLVHEMLGWQKLIPESMAMYQAGRTTFRKASKPEPEARLWMLEGIAGDIQPWWHHVGAQQEDRRQFLTAESVYQWHEANEEFLIEREPIASVGLVWSQKNTDFFGRDRASELVELPWKGWSQALVRARIPYLPIHADDLDQKSPGLDVLILPNLGALSEAQAESLRKFVQRGGVLIATGRTSLYNEWGEPRPDFALADLFACHYVALGREGERPRESRAETLHTYLRIEERFRSNSARSGKYILDGFDQTAILPYGGWLGDVIAAEGSLALLTYVPAFPIYPPETSWMREPRTNIPGLLLNEQSQGGRVAFLVADVDFRYAMDHLPDHGNLLANLVRWATNNQFPVTVDGPGLIDCRLYRQSHRLILHLVNLTNPGAWRSPVDQLIPIGPIKITIKTPGGQRHGHVRRLVAKEKPSFFFGPSEVTIRLTSILDHEVLVVA